MEGELKNLFGKLFRSCRGIMVDPPPFSTHILKKKGITQNVIEWMIITHCHADHDAGAFQKILESSKVEVIILIYSLYFFSFQ
jgi:glyoxylase-like metal-dependent hydrolase (beta-lactamase superfamily II)